MSDRKVYPAKFTGRAGPTGTGEFFTGVKPGSVGEAARDIWAPGDESWSFHLPEGAWLGVTPDELELPEHPNTLHYVDTDAYVGRTIEISPEFARQTGRPDGQRGTVTKAYQCNFVGVTMDGTDWETPLNVKDLTMQPEKQPEEQSESQLQRPREQRQG